MNSSNPHGCTISSRFRRTVRVFTAVLLVTLLFAAPAVQAGPVTINQVVQTLSRNQGPTSLIVSVIAQDPVGGAKVTTPTTGSKSDEQKVQPVAGAPKLDGLLSNMSVVQDPQNVGVEVVEAEVEGTICDCGDILLPAGGFPKWPFLFLAAVPLIFIHECQDCNDSTPTPTPTPLPSPTPTPTPVPEPASLILFGSGLLAASAGLRRRYARNKE